MVAISQEQRGDVLIQVLDFPALFLHPQMVRLLELIVQVITDIKPKRRSLTKLGIDHLLFHKPNGSFDRLQVSQSGKQLLPLGWYVFASSEAFFLAALLRSTLVLGCREGALRGNHVKQTYGWRYFSICLTGLILSQLNNVQIIK